MNEQRYEEVEFSHEKLIAYRVAREFAGVAYALARKARRSDPSLADQLSRASSSILLNTAEGAGRRTGREKARFFDIARGSATECAGCLDLVAIASLAAPGEIARGRELLHRGVRLLAGLARSARSRGP